MLRYLYNIAVKHSFVFKIYSFCASVICRLLSLFIKVDPKTILFTSFSGLKYDDSPRAIYERIKNDSRFKDYKLVWVFRNPERFDLDAAIKVELATPGYYYHALRAKCWISNTRNFRFFSHS